MEPNEGAAEQAQDTQQQGGQQDPMQAIDQLGQSLAGLGDALQKAGAPPEVLKPLGESIQKFQEFAAMLTGKGQAPAPGNMDANQAPGSQPANY